MAGARKKQAAKSEIGQRQRSIYAVVAKIPRGRVASYGQVAERAGLPRGARVVGRAMKECTADVPWHRVLNAAGRIALPPGSAAFREQVRRLAAEGVVVIGGRVAARYFDRQSGELDELLWGPRGATAGRTRRRRRS